MTFDDLQAGDAIFVDTNALIYQILPVSEQLVLAATQFSQQFELLTGDALVVAAMRGHGLKKLASADSDFDRVPGITRYAPV